MTTSHEELVKLEELAKKATPGPWKANTNTRFITAPPHDAPEIAGVYIADWEDNAPQAAANCQYIAAASPDVILSLVERVKERDEWLKSRDEQITRNYVKALDDGVRMQELEWALKPFAEKGNGEGDGNKYTLVEVEHCRKARAALAPDSK